MAGIYRLIRTAPLMPRVPTSEGCTYLYRGIKFAGWLPPQNGRRYIYLIWSFLVFTFSTFYLPIGYLLTIVIDLSHFTPGEFLAVLQLSIEAAGVTVRSIIVIFFMSRLHQTRLVMHKLDKQLRDDQDHQKIHKALAQSNYVFLAYFTLFLGYTLSMLVTNVWMGKPPWMLYNPLFDWRQGIKELWMQSFLEYIIVSIAVFTDVLTDTYTLVYMILFRAHIDVLKDHICKLRTDPKKTEDDNYEELVDCIIYHKLILDCCNLMRPVMSRTIFVQFLLIGIVLGLTMINLWYFLDVYSGFSSIVYLTALLLETFPFCFLCDLLVEDCDDLSNKLAESKWLAAQQRYQATVKIFLQQIQQPISFMAGGIFPITMSTNIKMAKFAFSVMTIVQQMNLTDRFTSNKAAN